MLFHIAAAGALLGGLTAGIPQIVTMVRSRSSASQSPVGWALGTHSCASAAYVGASKGAALIVYAPPSVAAAVSAAGLATALYFKR